MVYVVVHFNSVYFRCLNQLYCSNSLPNGFLGFWERFFAVAFHIAVSSIAGYGLAKRMGWQFYLIASFLHGLVNYGVILAQAGLLNTIQLEIYVAVLAVVTTAAALWLRWFRPEEDEDF